MVLSELARPASLRGRTAPGRRESRYRGVILSVEGKYKARVTVSGKAIHLGVWRCERDAAIARDRGVLFFGLERPLNLPRASSRLGPESAERLRWQARQRRKAESGKSPFCGVQWDSIRTAWVATIAVTKGKRIRIAAFDDGEDAAVACDRVARHLFGREALLNFPDRKLRPASIDQIRAQAWRRSKDRTASTFTGVYPSGTKGTQRWVARIRHPRNPRPSRLSLGYWATEREAALAHDRAALHYFGLEAHLNLPALAAKLGPATAVVLRREAGRQFKTRTTSRFRGVCRESPEGAKWVSRVRYRGENHFLGVFDTDRQAARAYDNAAFRFFGKLAKLNFPDRGRRRGRAS
jgi:hypothetical protein